MAEEKWVARTGGMRSSRTRHEWSDLFPIVLRSANHVTVTSGRFRQPWSQRLIMVKWVVRGEIEMAVAGRRHKCGPGQAAVHVPTQPHAFWCNEEGSELCWFSVDGPAAEQFAHLLGLRAGVYDYGPAPVEQIAEMAKPLNDPSLEACRRASLLGIQALYDLAARLPRPQLASIVHQVRHRIREGISDPELSAQRLATQLHYNRGSLSRLFHQQSGLTIIDCITQTRLQEAELLLTRTDERVGDIARKCGFRDVSYFTRWIKKHTGRLPRELRSDASAAEAVSAAGKR